MRFFPSAETLRSYVLIVADYERFLMTLGCGIANTILRWCDKIDVDTYEFIIMGTVGAFVTANAVQAVATVRAKAAAGNSTQKVGD